MGDFYLLRLISLSSQSPMSLKLVPTKCAARDSAGLKAKPVSTVSVPSWSWIRLIPVLRSAVCHVGECRTQKPWKPRIRCEQHEKGRAPLYFRPRTLAVAKPMLASALFSGMPDRPTPSLCPLDLSECAFILLFVQSLSPDSVGNRPGEC